MGIDASATMLELLLSSQQLRVSANSKLVHQLWLISPASGTLATHNEVAARHSAILSRANCSDSSCLAQLKYCLLVTIFKLYSMSYIFCRTHDIQLLDCCCPFAITREINHCLLVVNKTLLVDFITVF